MHIMDATYLTNGYYFFFLFLLCLFQRFTDRYHRRLLARIPVNMELLSGTAGMPRLDIIRCMAIRLVRVHQAQMASRRTHRVGGVIK